MAKPQQTRRKKAADASPAFEAALASSRTRYVLRLFIAGTTPRSAAALANLKDICETHLAGRYELEVIDVYQQPRRARDEQILAVPTLVKVAPSPLRRLIGDMSVASDVLRGLGVRLLATPRDRTREAGRR